MFFKERVSENMRKKISFTMINNEADNIESFIRYHRPFLDRMIIIDNGSTDHSLDIIQKLIQEGYPITVYDESMTGFEQFCVENKYLRIVAEKYDSDMIIPLDSDEFLFGLENPNDIIEELSLDTIYQLRWRTFVKHPQDNEEDEFTPRRMKYSYLHKDHKVMIPTHMVKDYNLILAPGQHSVTGASELKIIELPDLFLAHYPNRSVEQFQIKSLCHSIRNVMYLNRQNNESIHRNYFAKVCIENLNSAENDWFYNLMDERRNLSNSELEYFPINPKSHELDNTVIRYSHLAHMDLFQYVYDLAQFMAIRSYNMEMKMKENPQRPIIIIYGTGKSALNLFRGIPKDLVDIRAYINSNEDVKFSMFEGRLIITPKWIKFFPYDKIVISSVYYHDEMYSELINQGVNKDKIVNSSYLMEQFIQKG